VLANACGDLRVNRQSVVARTANSPAKSFAADAHYRPDVDGLRAVAVIPVILFHAGFGFISGGFVGVDVFFVISGFLITGILAREIAEGRYSILEFYRRRARRIFPALSAMALATLAVGYVILTPSEYVEIAKSAVSVSIFSSNFYFWKSVSYFHSGNEIRPLLHSWSLAVEEQYYLLFPLLLRVLNVRRQGLVATLWVVAFLSFAIAAALVPWKPNAAFYLLPSRAWELMLGGLLAVGQWPAPPSRRAASIGSLIGVALIAIPMVSYTAATPFPGFAAAPPCLGTALIIWAGGDGFVARLLSRPVPVAVGKASYSIYLWHLPILVFATYLLARPLSTTVALSLCLASVAVGFASLSFIERPFRSPPRSWNRNRVAAAAAFAMAVTGISSLAVIGAGGLPSRLGAASASLVATADDEHRHHSECMTVDEKIVQPESACRLGDKNVPPTALLWGDSHAMVTATALEQAAIRKHAAFLFAADADCPPGIGFEIDPSVDPGLTSQLSYRYCADYNNAMLRLALRSPAIKTVILSARWTNWRIGEPPNPVEQTADVRLRDYSGMADSTIGNRSKWERGFVTLVDRLTSANKKVVVVGPLPEPTVNVPHQLYVERFGFADSIRPISVAEFRRRHRTILNFFEGMRVKKGVTFVWPQRALCSLESCPVVQSGKPVFFDHNHLSMYGAGKTSPLYDPLFDADN
jgi:peptidoglycan/LPS O-acetylase OafA/YrhL